MCKMSLTLDETGRVLTETIDGVTMPVDYTFKCVNDFVHLPETQFEELQGLALGMVSHIAKLEERLGFQGISLDHNKMLLASCESALLKRDEQIEKLNKAISGDKNPGM